VADILMDLIVKAPAARVFDAFTTPAGLDSWWTKGSRLIGKGGKGCEVDLLFGPGYEWRARYARYEPGVAVEMKITAADRDWVGTRVGARLNHKGGTTTVRFYHKGWPANNEHWRISCYCWAAYLRIMRRTIEHGETVPYERRLDV